MAVEPIEVPGRCLLQVPDPRRWMAEALRILFPAPQASIHPSAQIGHGVKLGRGVSVGPFTFGGDGAVVGDDSRIGSHTYIHPGTVIGKGCLIKHHCTIGADGFAHWRVGDTESYSLPHLGCLYIGDNVEIGSQSVIMRGLLDDTIIESGVRIGNLCNIGGNCIIRERAFLRVHVVLGGGVVVEKDVTLATGVLLLSKVKVGEGAQVGMGSVVVKDVPTQTSVFGVPAKKLPTMREIV